MQESTGLSGNVEEASEDARACIWLLGIGPGMAGAHCPALQLQAAGAARWGVVGWARKGTTFFPGSSCIALASCTQERSAQHDPGKNRARTGAMWQRHLPKGPGLDLGGLGRQEEGSTPTLSSSLGNARHPRASRTEGARSGTRRWTSTEKGPFISLWSLTRQADNAPMLTECCTALGRHHIAISHVFSSRIQQCRAFVFDHSRPPLLVVFLDERPTASDPSPSLINWMAPRNSARPVSYCPDWARLSKNETKQPKKKERKNKSKNTDPPPPLLWRSVEPGTTPSWLRLVSRSSARATHAAACEHSVGRDGM